MDTMGDHALSCRKDGDGIARHNSVARVIFRYAREGGVQAKWDAQSPLARDNSRPGDVILQEWHNGRPLYLDVSVVNPLCPSYVKRQFQGHVTHQK